LYHTRTAIPNIGEAGFPIISDKREIRLPQKRSYKNKKTFIDFYVQMQENEERRRVKSVRFAATRRYFESIPEDDQ